MKKLLSISVVSLIVLSSALSYAGAGDRPFRTANAAQSKSAGLGAKLVRRIERLPGPGREQASASVIDRFAKGRSAAKATQVVNANALLTRGDGWSVEVRGTGEWIRFRDDAYIDGPNNKPIAPSQRISGDALEQRGREIIQNELAPYIPLGPGEALAGWSVYRLMNSSADASGIIEEQVVASRILLTRVIDGVPVVGPGGKVSIIIANDGTLVGFDLDWPALQVSGTPVKTSEIATIQARSDALLGVTSGSKRPLPSVFECGYYDPGVAGVDMTRTLSPACVLIVDQGAGSKSQIVVPIDTK